MFLTPLSCFVDDLTVFFYQTVTFVQVILPVVARKKGLDGHYENADGGPQVKKVVKPTIAPVRSDCPHSSSSSSACHSLSDSSPLIILIFIL
jgi:hypothetical protein